MCKRLCTSSQKARILEAARETRRLPCAQSCGPRGRWRRAAYEGTGSSVAEQVTLRQILNGDDVIRHGCAIQVQIRSADCSPAVGQFCQRRSIASSSAVSRTQAKVTSWPNCSRCAIRLQIWARLPAVGGSVGNRRYDQWLHEPSTS